jgi:hypothetical protein
LRARWRHYLNLAKTEGRLEVLLRHFRFGTLADSLLDFAPAAFQPSPLRRAA